MAAALGIVHNFHSNRQKIFGGGIVQNIAKNRSDDSKSHTDDIKSLNVSSDKSLVATG